MLNAFTLSLLRLSTFIGCQQTFDSHIARLMESLSNVKQGKKMMIMVRTTTTSWRGRSPPIMKNVFGNVMLWRTKIRKFPHHLRSRLVSIGWPCGMEYSLLFAIIIIKFKYVRQQAVRNLMKY